MTIEEILAALKSDAERKVVTDAIATAAEAEKNVGIGKYNKKDGEVLKLKSNLRSLGYDSEKFENIEAFIDSRKAIEEKATTGEVTIATLTGRVDTMESERTAEKLQSAKDAKEVKEGKLTTKLTKEIGGKFYGSDSLIKVLISEKKVDFIGGKTVFKDGDDIVAFETGVKNLMESNKENLKADQKPGSGDIGGEAQKPEDEKSFAEKIADSRK